VTAHLREVREIQALTNGRPRRRQTVDLCIRDASERGSLPRQVHASAANRDKTVERMTSGARAGAETTDLRGKCHGFRRVNLTEACHRVGPKISWKRPEKRESSGTARVVPNSKHPYTSIRFRQHLDFGRGGQQTKGKGNDRRWREKTHNDKGCMYERPTSKNGRNRTLIRWGQKDCPRM